MMISEFFFFKSKMNHHFLNSIPIKTIYRKLLLQVIFSTIAVNLSWTRAQPWESAGIHLYEIMQHTDLTADRFFLLFNSSLHSADTHTVLHSTSKSARELPGLSVIFPFPIHFFFTLSRKRRKKTRRMSRSILSRGRQTFSFIISSLFTIVFFF